MNNIYEINTPIFLREVSLRTGHVVTLADIPEQEWDAIAHPSIDTVWFMGVWKRSPIAREMAKDEEWLKEALPDMKDEDLLGSAYSIQEYVVDESLGGNDGLAVAREALKQRGIKIIVDYVPNHVGIDHHWVIEHPDYFLSGTEHELKRHPEAFVHTPSGIFAKGKDPNFEPWSDVLQLNAFSPGFRQEVVGTLQYIASIADGVRCDMAMLMMNTIFKDTWKHRVGDIPETEYWPHIITAVREVRPDFLFLAEVYWDKQQDLLDQGFDLCYDKDLYDHLLHGSLHKIREHLERPVEYQNHLLRFLENHDEERAAHEFPLEKHKAAAVVTMTLPGSHLYHDGEREGRKIRIPVHLGRRADEVPNEMLINFYDKLQSFVQSKDLEHKKWQLTPVKSRLLHRESRHVIAWTWSNQESQCTVFVNYSHEKAVVRSDIDVKRVSRVTDIIKGDVALDEYITGSRMKLGAWQHVVIEQQKTN
ncbi:MAG: alpha amylase [Candidatus Saccharibacteria bacterium]|nr:alpha amylase [Candidatus Saccharibacteria bacterium]